MTYRTVLREYIPFGFEVSVFDSPEAAIAKLKDPHATMHQVPEEFCREGKVELLLELLRWQKEHGRCFSVWDKLAKIREKEEADG